MRSVEIPLNASPFTIVHQRPRKVEPVHEAATGKKRGRPRKKAQQELL